MYQPINISEKINGRQKTTLVCLYSMHSVTKCRLSGYRKTCTSDDMNLAQAISCKVQAVCLTLTDDNRQIHMALVCKQQTTHQLYKKQAQKAHFCRPSTHFILAQSLLFNFRQQIHLYLAPLTPPLSHVSAPHSSYWHSCHTSLQKQSGVCQQRAAQSLCHLL